MRRNRLPCTAVAAALLTLLVGACKIGLGLSGGGFPYLRFDVQPSAVPAGTPIFPAVRAEFGDVEAGAYSCDLNVSLALTGTAGATLSGGLAQTASGNVAIFADLSVDRPGTYSLTATAPCFAAASSSPFNITGPVVSVAITPSNVGLTALGDTLKLTAQGRDAANVATGGQFAWTSSDTTKVRVSAVGVVTAVAYGGATITAAVGGVSSSARVTVAPMAGALTSLSAGGSDNTCGVTTGGAAYCWGANYYGQLGVGTDDWTHSTPLAVTGGLSFVTLSVGGGFACGLIAGGMAYCWGYNGNGQLGTTAAISECWWAGIFSPVPCSTVPVAVAGGLSFTALSAGIEHVCGVTIGGAAYCWGDNTHGQLGDGTRTSRSTPVAVAGGLTFASVSAGAYHTCGVTTAGAGYCWGDNTYGQLGDSTRTGRSTPGAVAGGRTFVSVSAGMDQTCGLTTGGAAYCWDAGYGVPVELQGGLIFATVSAGGGHACGVTASGAAYCWGGNGYGQLGNGSQTSSSMPVAVAGGLTFASVSAGGSHTCGVTTGGVGYCWGHNFYGKLGNGSATDASAVPVLVAGQSAP